MAGREPGGYIAWLRGQIGPALVPVAYATGIVRDAEGRILFQRRDDFGDAWWGLPGGVIEPGEAPEACLRREVLEETGLQVEPLRLTGVYSSPRYAVTYPNGDRVQQVTLCYECRIAAGRARPRPGEIAELRFHSASQLPATPRWYGDMLAHALDSRGQPYFDAPEQADLGSPYRTLLDVRRVVGHAPLIWPGTSAGIWDEDGRILLQRRADFDAWGLPGGALDVGESLAQALIREVREETGLDVRPEELLLASAGNTWTFPNQDVIYPVNAHFSCRVAGGELNAGSPETLELRYFAPKELPPLEPDVLRRVEASTAARGAACAGI